MYEVSASLMNNSTKPGIFRGHGQDMLRKYGRYIRDTQGLCKEYIGIMTGISNQYVGDILGICWGYDGDMLGFGRVYARDMRGYAGDILRICPG